MKTQFPAIKILLFHLPIIAASNTTSSKYDAFKGKDTFQMFEELMAKHNAETREELTALILERDLKLDIDSVDVQSKEEHQLQDTNITKEFILPPYDLFGKTPPMVKVYDKLIARYVRLIANYTDLNDKYLVLVERKKYLVYETDNKIEIAMEMIDNNMLLAEQKHALVRDEKWLLNSNGSNTLQISVKSVHLQVLNEANNILEENKRLIKQTQKLSEQSRSHHKEIMRLYEAIVEVLQKCRHFFSDIKDLMADKKTLPISF